MERREKKVIFKWNGDKNKEYDIINVNSKFAQIEKGGVFVPNWLNL